MQLGAVALILSVGQLRFLKAERLDGVLCDDIVDAVSVRVLTVHDERRKALQIVLRGFDIASVGKIERLVARDDANTLGDAVLRRVHPIHTPGQQQRVHICEQATIFFQIAHVVSSFCRWQ